MAHSGHVALYVDGNVGYEELHFKLAPNCARGAIGPLCRKLLYLEILEVADSHERRGDARLIGHTPAK